MVITHGSGLKGNGDAFLFLMTRMSCDAQPYWTKYTRMASLGMVKKQDRRELTLAPGFPDGASAKEPTCQCRRRKRSLGLIPGSRRSPGRGHGNPLQYSCLENSMDRGAWWAQVHRVSKSWTRLKWLSMQLLLTLWDRAAILVHLWHVINKSLSAVLQYRFIAHSWFCELAEAVLFGMNPWTWSRFATNVLTHWFPLCVGV